jgi:uncharacterized repeat protein (TIGR01451 family)
MFELVLRNAANASIIQSNAFGFIFNDDPLPMVSVSDISVSEGREGQTAATLVLTLSQPSGFVVNVPVETIDGTASGLSDYVPTNAVVTFAPGEMAAQMTVFVQGDSLLERDESFLLRLYSSDNATLAVAEARVTILNDEVGIGVLDRFEIGGIPSPQTIGRPFNVTISARDGGNTILPFNGVVSLMAHSGTNLLTLMPTNSVTLVDGLWSGALALSVPYSNVVLTASDGGGHDGESNPFDVNVADLRLSASAPPEALIEFPFNYVLVISNAAANPATAVSVTNVFSSEVSLVSASVPGGACSFADGIVSCQVGTLTNGEPASIPLVLLPVRGGSLTNTASVAAFEFDPVPGNNVRVNVLDITGDADADGLPDSWEAQVGLSSSNPNDARQDADGDRHTNLQEYVAGTDPMNPASVLKVFAEVNGTTARISFITVAGRRYRIEGAPAPAGPWTSLGGELVGEGDVAVLFDPVSGAPSQRFYRVQVLR